MKIVILEGYQEADYIINQFKNKKNHLCVINSNLEICEYLSKKNHIDVVYGKITKEYDLNCAQIDEADLFIALSNDDIQNYVSCQMAKLMFKVKHVIACCANPKNVEIFKKLGIDSVISSTYLLGETIKSELSLEKMMKTLTFENNKIAISEFEIKENYLIANKALKDIVFPKNTSVFCIYSSTGMIIPRGETKIHTGDKVLIVSSYNDTEIVKELVTKV